MRAATKLAGNERRLADGKPIRRAPAKAPGVLPQRPAGQRVVSQVLVDVINPGFKERVDPMIAILWQLLEDPTKMSNEMRTGINLPLPRKPIPAPTPAKPPASNPR